MFPFLFKYGQLKISSYGVMLAVSFILGVWAAKKFAKKDGITDKHIDSVSFWLILSGVLGSRFLYVFVEHYDEYIQKPIRFFYVQEGGLSFSGGLVAAIVATVIYCHKKNLPFWKLADILSPSLALGFSLSKIGCFLMGCCHGSRCDLPWAVTYTHPESLASPKGIPLHPSQIYESISSMIIFGLLVVIFRKRSFHGQVFLSLLILYGITRSLLDSLRGETGHLGPLTTAQAINIPLILGAFALWMILAKKKEPTSQKSNSK